MGYRLIKVYDKFNFLSAARVTSAPPQRLSSASLPGQPAATTAQARAQAIKAEAAASIKQLSTIKRVSSVFRETLVTVPRRPEPRNPTAQQVKPAAACPVQPICE
jgi:hypothetical protein